MHAPPAPYPRIFASLISLHPAPGLLFRALQLGPPVSNAWQVTREVQVGNPEAVVRHSVFSEEGLGVGAPHDEIPLHVRPPRAGYRFALLVGPPRARLRQTTTMLILGK
jgi:hypothetical protein